MSYRRLIACIVSFVFGAAVGWIVHEPKKAPPAPSPVDYTQEITVQKPYGQNPTILNLKPYGHLINGVRDENRPVVQPADVGEIWVVNIDHGAVMIWATNQPPPSQR